MSALRVAVLGSGWSARRLVASLPADAVVAATVHRVTRPAGSGHQSAPAMTYEAFENFDEFDAALVCTPPHTQVEIASSLIQRRKHLVLEKPAGLSSAALDAVVTAAAAAGLVVQVPFHLMHLPAVRAFIDCRLRGTLGAVRHLTHRMFVSAERAPAWLRTELSGGPFLETMVHGFHLARALCGPVEHGSGLPEGTEGAAALLRHSGGALSVLEVSWRAQPATRRGGIEVIADGGQLVVDRGTVAQPWLSACLYTPRGEHSWSHADELSFELFMKDFVERCLTSSPPDGTTNLESARQALALAEEVGTCQRPAC